MKAPVVPNVHVVLSVEELQAVLRLLEDQLFRVKFIDPKIPGHRPEAGLVRIAETAVGTLRESLAKAKPNKLPAPASNIDITSSRQP